MSRPKFFMCGCYHEAVAVDVFEDSLGKTIYLSMWYYGTSRYTVRTRLHHIWQIIRRGHPYLDEICLTPEKTKELGQYLINCAQ